MTYNTQQLFGGIESRNYNPASIYDFQQGSGFIHDFGAGAGGFNTWLGRGLSANPNWTIGDAYAQYNSGTGTPGSGISWDQLANGTPLQQAAYRNASGIFAQNGVDPSTPVSQIESGVSSAAGDLGYSIPNQPNLAGGADYTGSGAAASSSSAGTPGGGGDQPSAFYPFIIPPAPEYGFPGLLNPSAPGGMSLTGGQSSQQGQGFFTAAFDAIDSFVGRIVVMALGVIFILGAVLLMAGEETVKKIGLPLMAAAA